MSSIYKPVYDAAIKELTELVSESETLNTRLDQVAQRIAEVKKGALALAPLCGEQPWVKYPHLFPEMTMLSGWGLTPQIRAVLAKPPSDWMTPVAIRDAVKEAGYKGKIENLLPSVHTVLKRLKDAEEVEDTIRDGRTLYRWIADYDPTDEQAVKNNMMRQVVRGLKNLSLERPRNAQDIANAHRRKK